MASAILLAAPAAASASPVPIFVPNAGFEEGVSGTLPAGWSDSLLLGTGPLEAQQGHRISLDRNKPFQGKASARISSEGGKPVADAFGVLSTRIDATAHRGKRVRLTAAVRSEAPPETHVGLWMRVDLPERRHSFFDNMQDRPVRMSRWAEYVLEGDVAADADEIVFGLLLQGAGSAWIDSVRLEQVGDARGWLKPSERPRTSPGEGDEPARPIDEAGLANLKALARLYGYLRYFHPSDAAAKADWGAVAMAGVERVENARGPQALAAALNQLFKPLAPTFEAFPTARPPRQRTDLTRPPSEQAYALRWHHRGIGEDPGGFYRSVRQPVESVASEDVLTLDLGAGVSARIPLFVWKEGPSAGQPLALPAPTKPAGYRPSGFDRTTRLAGVIDAWNVFHHFYPYFDVVEADWPAELDKALRAAAVDQDDLAFHRTLRRLVAALDDGHGTVAYSNPANAYLPIDWEWIEDRLVVTAVGASMEGIAAGDVVTHVNGVPSEQALGRLQELHSGSIQWTRPQALNELLAGLSGSTAELRLSGPGGDRALSLPYAEFSRQSPRVREKSGEPMYEIAPGILYVDLTRITPNNLQERKAELAAAKGLIFDVRGYPSGSPWYLGHLTGERIQSPNFATPIWTRPGEASFDNRPWNIDPLEPRFTSNVAFLTDGRALSFAESVLGTVKAKRLGTIVGGPTGGANGNVTLNRIPGGYMLAWTAMRVTNPDGSPHHVVGIAPDVPASRTIAGVRAGRDEVLERALALVRDGAAARD